MRLFWDDINEDVGGHYLKLIHDDGTMIAEAFLRDYTCDYQKQIERPERQKNIKFEYSYCNGVSMHREITDNITLKEAKVIVEKWFVDLHIASLESTKRRVKELENICEYLNKCEKYQ